MPVVVALFEPVVLQGKPHELGVARINLEVVSAVAGGREGADGQGRD